MNTGVEHTTKPKAHSLMAAFNAPAAHDENDHAPRKLTANEEMGLQKSGYVHKSISLVSSTGEYADDDEDNENSEKRKQRSRIATRMFEWNKSNVLSSLTNSINFDMDLMSTKFYKPVEQKDMLRNDKGEIVKTSEEKQQMERRGKMCSALLAQDEVTLDPKTGMMITTRDARINMVLQERVEYRTQIFAKIQKGEMKVDDVPPELRKELTDPQYSKKATFFDRMMIEQSALSIKPDHAPKPIAETSGKYTFKQEPYVAAPAPTL